jgi:predicted lactoylglutathione lyase
MVNEIYVNLPVKDLPRTVAFFRQLGFEFNPAFTNEHAAGMIVGDRMFVMLLSEPMFQGFTPKPVSDAHRSTEVLVALSLESRAAVDAMAAAAVAAGGRLPRAPQDHGFMYAQAFEDLDGHIWEPFWMDPTHQMS